MINEIEETHATEFTGCAMDDTNAAHGSCSEFQIDSFKKRANGMSMWMVEVAERSHRDLHPLLY